MATLLYNLLSLPLAFSFLLILLSPVSSVNFTISRFDPNANNILYQGAAIPSVGAIELIDKVDYLCRVGRAIYAERVRLWDSNSGTLFDFSTRFSFTIDTQGRFPYGHGVAFFLAPVGSQIPPNSAGGFLGLFNTTTSDSSLNQIVLVEFDSFNNPEWDPTDVDGHVGINNNSIASAVYTPWNVSLHDKDTADVWITYNAITKNLSVYWTYQKTNNPQEPSSLSYQIDLMKVLPEWVIIGLSAATGQYVERNSVESWEFSSSLDIKEKNPKNTKKIRLIVPVAVLVVVLVLVAISVVFLVLVAIIASTILWRRMVRRKTSEATVNLTSINTDALERGVGPINTDALERGVGPRRFSYRCIASATNNFSDEMKLGEGGFGTVYKGYLVDIDREVAVKKNSKNSNQGEKEYITEVNIISRLRHRNVVQLIGWCHDRGEFILVYEFMPNGSLDAHLFGKRGPLPWAVRYKIALGLAAGLLYLHEEWEQCVVHRNIKSRTVLLDSSFNVKLGDFGLALLMDHGLVTQTTELAGTFGYVAPEYFSGRISKELDVYSFGVVALEIATGKKVFSPMEQSPQLGLVGWVWDLYGSGKLHLAVDDKLNMNFDEKQVECLMIVGLWCAHPDFSLRPSIRQAIQVINFEAELPNLLTKMPVPTLSVSSGETSDASEPVKNKYFV